MLDIVGGGQVHDVGPVAPHDLHPGLENKFGQFGAVDRRDFHAHHVEHVFDAVFLQAGLVGFLR